MYNPRKRLYMPMLQIEGPYSAKGLRGLAKDLGRRAALKDALAALGVIPSCRSLRKIQFVNNPEFSGVYVGPQSTEMI
jgi:hypothetical protein